MHALQHSRLLACLLACAATALAPASARTRPACAGDDDGSREARRILHLTNGQTIRVLARQRDGVWEYHGRTGWKELAPMSVRSAALESEVLREWNGKKTAVGSGDLAARTRTADWALSAGLAVEGLDEMTAVLALDPDHADALSSLVAHADVMSVPPVDPSAERRSESTGALLRFGASVPGAARELAVLELGRLPRDEELAIVLLSELRSRIVARRSFAALALRRLLPAEGIRPLLLHAVLDPSDEVRRSSSLALRAVGEPGLIVPIVRVVENSPSATLRRNAAEALGEMGYPAAVEPLVGRLAAAAAEAGSSNRVPHAHIFVGQQVAYIQDFDVEVAQFQAVADPKVGVLIEGSTLDAAVTGVQDIETSVEVAAVRTSLERLTRASPGKTTKAWLAWWQANASLWRSEDLSRPPAAKTGAAAGG